jgi:hypothetical protein
MLSVQGVTGTTAPRAGCDRDCCSVCREWPGLLLSVQGVTGTNAQRAGCAATTILRAGCDRDYCSASRVWQGLLLSEQGVTGTTAPRAGCDLDDCSTCRVSPSLPPDVHSVTGNAVHILCLTETAAQPTVWDLECCPKSGVYLNILIIILCVRRRND